MRHQINKSAEVLICRMFKAAQNLTTMHENDYVLILSALIQFKMHDIDARRMEWVKWKHFIHLFN